MTVLIVCVAVLAVCLLVAVYLAISTANDSKRAWTMLTAANDEAHKAALAKLFETPSPKIVTTPEIEIDTDLTQVPTKPIPKRVEAEPTPKGIDGRKGLPGPSPEQLRALRHSRGWSMHTLSQRSGLSMGFLSRHETGTYLYRHEQLAKLKAVFGDELTPKSDKPKTPKPTTKAAYPDRLRDAVQATLNDLLSDDLPQPLVSYTNGLYQIDATLWGGKTLSYRVPEGQSIDDTVRHVREQAGSLVSNPYA
jgi:transcriptional regulator with XRE-family HTH domain